MKGYFSVLLHTQTVHKHFSLQIGQFSSKLLQIWKITLSKGPAHITLKGYGAEMHVENFINEFPLRGDFEKFMYCLLHKFGTLKLSQ